MCVNALIISLSVFVILVEAETLENYNGNRNVMKPHMLLNKKKNIPNGTYIEKSDNFVRLPNIKQSDFVKTKQKFKKSPKRTVQKIIKKNIQKSRKLYLNQATSTTQSSNKEYDFYAQEENQRQDEMTTQGNNKRRIKKYNAYPRNPPLFNHWNKRNKRELDRNDVYILEDLDSMKFLDHGKDYDIVRTHVKDYW